MIVTFLSLVASVLTGCSNASAPSQREQPLIAEGESPGSVPREFRAVWVATVANIDWPSKPGLSTAEQQAEAIAILDKCKSLNINAVVFQVRPGCDALYESKLEPWSYYLTGEQGRRPDPYYDPLKFWIDEAHARGMELHAWFNPYRARHSGAANKPQADSHVSKTNPAIVREFKGWQWLDPAEPAAQDLTYKVFMDVVKRYDVDGIHIDDYFYPYPDYFQTAAKTEDFPDDATWQRYQQSGGKLSRDDWRRDNVDRLIQRIYEGTKRTKKHVLFGISPFGQPNKRYAPPGVDVRFSQYDILYADAEKWLREGWLDYWTPQLYWPIAQKGQGFGQLVDYWQNANTMKRHFWPGLYTSRHAPRQPGATTPATASTQPANPNEIADQIQLGRDRGVTGHVHFSMRAIMENDALAEQLKALYQAPAIRPQSPWLENRRPPTPRLTAQHRRDGSTAVRVSPGWGEQPVRWVVWTRYGGEWTTEVHPSSIRSFDFPQERAGRQLERVGVMAIDRSANSSWPKIVTPK